ncbi:MAG: bifunctional serine/threonine-protein kinase/formylglycine-generating enzyme family protein [Pseudomonadota bacterium]
MKLCPVCGTQNQDAAATCENPDCQYGFDSSMNSPGTKLFEKQVVSFSDGSFIAERYEIVRELGRGGMGVVYLVKDSKLRGREVALKMTHPELISHDEARQRFEDEVILCLDLLHPNIVRVNNLDEWNNCLYFTMEYIPGKSLRQVIDERKEKISPFFTLQETILVINPVLEALFYAHQTTIHRDIKPENILIQGDFPDIKIKVLDFGIAKVLSASRFTRTAQSMGTAYFMSPEQMQGAKHVDLRADLYSVGMILYEMLTGKIAAGRFKLPGELVQGIPEQVDLLVEKTLSPEPDARFENAQKMIIALNNVVNKPLTRDLKEMESKESEQPISNIAEQEQSVGYGSFLGETHPLGMKFVYVKPGAFTMGSPSSEDQRGRDEKVHEVVLSKGYYMQTTQVTQEQWVSAMGNNPSKFKGENNFPVENISWKEVQEFISYLNSKETGATYRLPTEAEWEYAARAGGSYKYSGSDHIDSVAWYGSNSEESTHPVGTKQPNRLGLYDMSGNVWEWCQDWFCYYPSGSVTDPKGAVSGIYRLIRGGSWNDRFKDCRSAARDVCEPDGRSNTLGFRLVAQ